MGRRGGSLHALRPPGQRSRWGTNQYNNRQDDLGPAPWGSRSSWQGLSPATARPLTPSTIGEYFEDGGGRGERAGGAGGSAGAGAGEGLPDPQAHRLLLVRHAHSQVDPQRDPHTWGLTERGRRDAGRLAALALFDHASGYYSGAEPKMEQTLAPVAAARDDGAAEPALGETGSKGWLAEEGQFKAVVRRFFDHPRRPRPRVGDARRGDGALPGRRRAPADKAPCGRAPRPRPAGDGGHRLRGRMLCAYLAHALGLDGAGLRRLERAADAGPGGAGAGAGRRRSWWSPSGPSPTERATMGGAVRKRCRRYRPCAPASKRPEARWIAPAVSPRTWWRLW